MIDEQTQFFSTRVTELDNIGPTFCAAKWLQTTLYLQTGWNHSCHHPAPHKIPLDELEKDHTALHNTQFKKKQMQEMLDGNRPAECDYCWKAEDLGGTYSDRYYKTTEPWAWKHIPLILETKTENINPSYLEISFSNVCNFKCAYCSPDVSSRWVEEITSHGPYPTSWNTGNLDYLKQINRFPYHHKEENPYVTAFWKWWPELSKNLENLRLTGGEPLLSKDVWDLLEKLENDPNLNPNLILGINTNLNVPVNLIQRLIKYINNIAPRIKQIQLFTSNESTGAQAEYIRYGLNYQEWHNNLENLIENLPSNAFVGIMSTVNICSLSTLDEFLEEILNLRKKYYKSYSENTIILSINYLRWPPYLHLNLAPTELKSNTILKLKKLVEKYKDSNFLQTGHYAMLYESDIHRIDLICNLLEEEPDQATWDQNCIDFYKFVTEYDIRKNTNFNQTFPELIEFKNYCKRLATHA